MARDPAAVEVNGHIFNYWRGTEGNLYETFYEEGSKPSWVSFSTTSGQLFAMN